MGARLFFVAVLLVFAAYGAYKELQLPATICLLGSLVLIHKHHVMRFIDTSLGLIEKASQAKYKDLEIKLGQRMWDTEKYLDNAPPWVHMLVASFTEDEIGILMAINNFTEFSPHETQKNSLRSQRAKGLITHNMPSMKESTIVSITDQGKELVNFLNNGNEKLRSKITL